MIGMKNIVWLHHSKISGEIFKRKKEEKDVGLSEINYKFVTDFEYYLKTCFGFH